MQEPLFWLDLSAYEGAKLKAVAVGNKIEGLLVDMSAGIDEGMVDTLRMLSFKPVSEGINHKLYTTDVSSHLSERLRNRLPQAHDMPFSAAEHLLIADTIRDADNAQPVRNSPQSGPTPQTDPNAEAPKAPTAEDAPPRLAVGSGDADNKQIRDTGVVHGFAIKDLRGRGDALLRMVGKMTDDQKAAHVSKKAIWPSIEYKKLVDNEGLEPGAAYLIKQMRDNLCTAPGRISARRRYQKTPHTEVYVHAIATIRDKMMAARTLDEAIDAYFNVMDTFCEQDVSTSVSGHPAVSCAYNDSPLTQDSKGVPLSESDRSLQGTIGPRAGWTYHAYNRNDPKSIEGVKDDIRRSANIYSDNNEGWRFLPRNNALRSGRDNKLSEEQKARRQEIEKGKAPTRVPRTLFADAVREGGKQWRSGDVAEIDLIERFDLSGVEFGNWESQPERQELMNQAYDGFNDMCQALGLPTEAIGFGGRLGMAFGSRGKGGKNPAAAHFEPSNFAINLTKKGGAGSLAHEWMHAFDRAATKRGFNGRTACMATDNLGDRHRDKLHSTILYHLTLSDETANNLHAVMQAIMSDPEKTLTDAVSNTSRVATLNCVKRYADKRPDLKIGNTWAYFDDHTASQILHATAGAIQSEWAAQCSESYHVQPVTARLLAQIIASDVLTQPEDKAVEWALEQTQKYHKIWHDDTKRRFEDAVINLRNELGDVLDDVSLIAAFEPAEDEHKGRLVHEDKNASLASNLKSLDWPGINDAWREEQSQSIAERCLRNAKYAVPARSNMLKVSKSMDRTRSKPYWSTRREMFARAMECYLKHKLEKQGVRNDFLVSYHKPSNANGKEYGGVYPSGSDLAFVAGAADKLFGGMRLQEMASTSPLREGKTGFMMHSLDGDSSTVGLPAPISSRMLHREVETLLGGWANMTIEHDMGEIDGHRVAGDYDPIKQAIRIAMDGADPLAAAHHEAYHVAEEHIMTAAERAIMASAFSPGGRYREPLENALRQDKKYHVLDQVRKNPAEARAYGFQYWMADRLAIPTSNPVGQILQRVKDVWESVRNVIRGYGYQTADDVLNDLKDGEMQRARSRAQGTELPDESVGLPAVAEGRTDANSGMPVEPEPAAEVRTAGINMA